MPDFSDPFSGNVPGRKLTNEELIRAIRLNIAAEHEAIFLYMAHADATDHPLAKEVLIDVANEEREHLGEFEYLLQVLTGDEESYKETGRKEVKEMAGEVGSAEAAEAAPAPEAGAEEATIGSLKD